MKGPHLGDSRGSRARRSDQASEDAPNYLALQRRFSDVSIRHRFARWLILGLTLHYSLDAFSYLAIPRNNAVFLRDKCKGKRAKVEAGWDTGSQETAGRMHRA